MLIILLISDIRRGDYPLLISSPEAANYKIMKSLLAEENFDKAILTPVVIDEAHSIIEWKSFRPIFGETFKTIISNISDEATCHLLTATCTQELYEVILKGAGMTHKCFLKL